MSQDLHAYLRERSRLSVMGWPVGVVLSVAFHGGVAGLFMLGALRPEKASESVKVTWVTLPAGGGSQASGGSAAMEEGKTGERVRRTEPVAPEREESRRSTAPTPNVFGTKATAPPKGTSKDQTSTGKAPVPSKGPVANPKSTPGATGSGNGGGLGQGSGIPGLASAKGVQGGTGLVGELEGSGVATWYIQQIQQKIVNNWERLNHDTGRVQIYFRIRRDGSIEGARVEQNSLSPALDQSALQAVKRASPLQPLPPGYEGLYLGIRYWFIYTGD